MPSNYNQTRIFNIAASLRLILMGILSSAVIGSCIAIPVPLLPQNPHEALEIQLQNEETSRESLIKTIGHPDFVLGKDLAVYAESKMHSALLIAGEGGAGAVSLGEIDYMLTVQFDDSDRVAHYELSEGSGVHEGCMEIGICFTPSTLNVPLAPAELDYQAKKFRARKNECSIYLFRDHNGDEVHESSLNYVNAMLARPKTEVDGVIKWSIENVAASVPGGYSLWHTPAANLLHLEVSFAVPFAYGFDIDGRADSARPPEKVAFSCLPGEIKFFRLFVPKEVDQSIVLAEMGLESAQTVMEKSRLLFNLNVANPAWQKFMAPALATESEDRVAKKFLPTEDKCTIYFYSHHSVRHWPALLTVQEIPSSIIYPDSYQRFLVSSGDTFRLEVHRYTTTLGIYRALEQGENHWGKSTVSIEVTCEPNEIIYVHQHDQGQARHLRLSLEQDGYSRAAIRTRALYSDHR